MRNVLSNSSGLSLIELVIAGALMGGLALAAGSSWTLVSDASKDLSARYDLTTGVVPVVQRIKTVGRLAVSCQKDVSNGALECVTQNSPGTPLSPATVRFIVEAGVFKFQEKTAGNVWVTKETAPGISELTVCDLCDMNSGCALEPAELSQQMVQYKLPLVCTPFRGPSSVFRFKVTNTQTVQSGTNPDGSAKAEHPVRGEYQSSFFIRNTNASLMTFSGS